MDMFSEDRGWEAFTRNLQNLKTGRLHSWRVRSSDCLVISKEKTLPSSEETFISDDILKLLLDVMKIRKADSYLELK